MIGYYDMVLGLIPVTLLGITGTLYGIGIETVIAVSLASLVAAGLVGHAMFIKSPANPPVESHTETPAVSASD